MAISISSISISSISISSISISSISISLRAVASLALASTLLSGCGGGGGGNSDVPPAPPTFTLSGVIQPADGNAVDGDVNDPTAPFTPNDEPANAQPIPNPVILGGYANRPGRGPAGRSRIIGDLADVFQVELAVGQTISLFIAEDGFINDLDLGLFDLSGNLIQASVGSGTFESIQVETGGEYLIVVQAFSGASNYILTTAQQTVPAAANIITLNDDFVPGDVVVRFQNTPGDSLNVRAASIGMAAKGGAPGRSMLFSLEESPQSAYQALGIAPETKGLRAADPEMQLKLGTVYAVKALSLRSDVQAASLNFRRHASLVPNDALFPIQYHYLLINLPQAWDFSTGAGAIIAVVDTGVLLGHPDLQGQLVPGFDFISDAQNANDGDGIDADPNDNGDRFGPSGVSSFHGTHVSGTAGAATNNQIGVAGVAFSARIMPLRVLGRFGGTDFDIEQAVRFAAGLPNDSGTLPEQKADVINLSLGGPGFSATAQQAFNDVRAANVIVVAAAGNERTSQPSFPASYDGVISVSAVDINKNLAFYSNFGPTVDVSGPGGDTTRDVNGDGFPDGVLSTIGDDRSGTLAFGFTFFQGTSMASPHVAGVAALMRSAHPGLTPQDMDNLLAGGALTDDLGPAGRDDNFGNGLINALKAVDAAIQAAGGTPIPPVPILSITPSALNFGISLTTMTLSVNNGGDGVLTVDQPSNDSGGFLGIAPQTDANGLGDYTVTVDRSGLNPGLYTATITFTSNAGTTQIPVIMQVLSSPFGGGKIGKQFVVLLDPTTNETITSVEGQLQSDGSYAFSRSGLAPGSYQIFAGTDSNNDFFICDEGESCGAYLTLDRPITLQLDSDHTVEFTSGFTSNLVNIQSLGSGRGLPLNVGKGVRQ